MRDNWEATILNAEKIENILSEQIRQAAIEVHRTLGGPWKDGRELSTTYKFLRLRVSASTLAFF